MLPIASHAGALREELLDSVSKGGVSMEHSTASLHAGKQYVPQRRAERLIATGRMILSAFFLLAIWIDPSEPSRYARLTYAILAGYLIYSLLLGVLTLKQYFNKGRLHVVT